jgi:hypothetical protein
MNVNNECINAPTYKQLRRYNLIDGHESPKECSWENFTFLITNLVLIKRDVFRTNETLAAQQSFQVLKSLENSSILINISNSMMNSTRIMIWKRATMKITKIMTMIN